MHRPVRGTTARVEPIPETLEALTELDASLDEATLLDRLLAASRQAREVAPGLVGVSVASRDHGVTFTLVATDPEIAALDGVQYLSSGPCVDAIDLGHGIATHGLLDESHWQDFARASAAHGVHSTLTLPVLSRGEVVSTINLYGRADETFTDRHQALAEVFGAWAPGAVTNADLSFSTRAAAEMAPGQLRELAVVDTATGILAGERRITVDEARAQLDDASRRAGVPVIALARVVVELHHHG
ncbi:GAF and ANTAR domain-containing protein [Alloalcanivorax gelatiniphagus]